MFREVERVVLLRKTIVGDVVAPPPTLSMERDRLVLRFEPRFPSSLMVSTLGTRDLNRSRFGSMARL